MTDNKQQPVDHRKASRHLLRLAGFALAFSFLLVLFSLLVIGLPEQLTQRINAQVLEAGIPLHFDSVRLSHRGWVLGNARIYSASPDDLKPMLRAKNCMFWHGLPAGKISPASIGILKYTSKILPSRWDTPGKTHCLRRTRSVQFTASKPL